MVIASTSFESLVNSSGMCPPVLPELPRLPLAIGKQEFTSVPTVASTFVYIFGEDIARRRVGTFAPPNAAPLIRHTTHETRVSLSTRNRSVDLTTRVAIEFALNSNNRKREIASHAPRLRCRYFDTSPVLLQVQVPDPPQTL